jgi:hypothetical protein
MTAAPSITNYQIPTGKVYWKDDENPTAGFVDLGNCVQFSINNAVTTKDHTRTYGGTRLVDKTIVTLVASEARFSLDEITETGVAMFAMGHKVDNTGGLGFDIFGLTRTSFQGILHINGDNSVGPRLEWIGYVSLSPSAEMFLIRNNDDWNEIPLVGKVQAHPAYGVGGTWTQRSIGEGVTA